jgi:alkylation response protein AidB-like acyl-CoA dehydrogenase
MAAAFLKPEAAQRLFGPSNAVLAWGAGIQGTAVAVDGGYRVSGKWRFASGSRHATLLGGHSHVVESDGSPRLGEDGQQQNATALIPREKATIDDVWYVMGLRGTGSDSYEIKDLFVPEDDMIQRYDRTTLQNAGPVYKIPTSLVYAGAFGGVMLGIARGMVRDLTALAANKTPRGRTSSLRDDPLFQKDLARLVARLRAARAYHMHTLADVWQYVSTHKEILLRHRMDIRLAATHTINEGAQVVVDAHRLAGEHAIFDSGPFERRLRDALSASQQVQGRATHYLTVGRHLLGLEPDSTMFI